jgi:hypothetical protein
LREMEARREISKRMRAAATVRALPATPSPSPSRRSIRVPDPSADLGPGGLVRREHFWGLGFGGARGARCGCSPERFDFIR